MERMKNKVELKKMLITIVVAISVFIVLFVFLLDRQYKTYTNNVNDKISMIFYKVIEEYPQIEKSDLIAILNEKENHHKEWFKEYGIDLEKESAILINDEKWNKFMLWDILLFILFATLLVFIFLQYNYRKDKKIKEITCYIEQINQKNYKLDIEDNTEDELSILKNELYKTTVMLKEIAENSIQDKIQIKSSLSDISHQLKTPITSILIMLDNILEDRDMEENIRKEFIKDIKREIMNIRFLVEYILKLSKIDSNTVTFMKKEVTIKEMIKEAIKNVEMISDLYNVNIQVWGNDTDTIFCDLKWQVEAITNVLKNAIEHSEEKGKIDIHYEQNKVYAKIEITDYGTGIDKQDLSHIFERFYQSKNSANESIGIGLALSKSIIESNNGYIQVDSELNKGTTFIIKYWQ